MLENYSSSVRSLWQQGILFVLLISELFNDEENSISLFGEPEGEEEPQLHNEKKIQSMIDDLTEMKNKL